MKVNTKTLLRPHHDPKNSPIGPQKSPSHLKKQKKVIKQKDSNWPLYEVRLIPLKFTSTSIKLNSLWMWDQSNPILILTHNSFQICVNSDHYFLWNAWDFIQNFLSVKKFPGNLVPRFLRKIPPCPAITLSFASTSFWIKCAASSIFDDFWEIFRHLST